jgi:hypothetical protein
MLVKQLDHFPLLQWDRNELGGENSMDSTSTKAFNVKLMQAAPRHI